MDGSNWRYDLDGNELYVDFPLARTVKMPNEFFYHAVTQAKQTKYLPGDENPLHANVSCLLMKHAVSWS
jgi:hypothetical protein